jgi:transposase
MFLTFLREKVMPLTNPYDPLNPMENSILVMDNASIHRGPEIRELCDEFGVLLQYLPPYSPDYNPIEESFAEMKAWMRKNRELAPRFGDDFGAFVELAVKGLAEKAGKHFRSCCIDIID